MQLVVIVGPTASGKTGLGIALAQHFGSAVVSADSRQVYAGMNVGTAKPSSAWGDSAHAARVPDFVESVPHYLLNIRTPDTPLTLAEWQESAFTVIDQCLAAEQLPFLVGGTMLYIDSVVHHFSVPQVSPNPAFREQLAREDTAVLYERLLAADPDAAQFIEPHHQQRIIRALEVISATGKPFSQQRRRQPPRYDCAVLGLFPGWDELERRIAERVEQMFAEGLLEETQALIKCYSKELPLLSTLNYAQAQEVLAGRLSREEATDAMVHANVRYAHRQMSWWKRRKEITWLDGSRLDAVIDALSR